MRTRLVSLTALLGAGALATGALASGGSSSATVKIPLPAAGQAQATLVTVTATAPKGKRVGPLKLSSPNASALGGAQLNSQMVATVSRKSKSTSRATFSIYVFIHRFPPVAAGARTADVLAEMAKLRLQDKASHLRFGIRIVGLDCEKLGKLGYTSDKFGLDVLNLVPSNDTNGEEQLDNAVLGICTQDGNPNAAERDDPGKT